MGRAEVLILFLMRGSVHPTLMSVIKTGFSRVFPSKTGFSLVIPSNIGLSLVFPSKLGFSLVFSSFKSRAQKMRAVHGSGKNLSLIHI